MVDAEWSRQLCALYPRLAAKRHLWIDFVKTLDGDFHAP